MRTTYFWVWVICSATAFAADSAITTVTLNGLELGIDSNTGAIRHMTYPGPGLILDADHQDMGLVDIAYPIEKFEPLRLSAKHSTNAEITQNPGQVVIRINKLGPSRGCFELTGEVAAVVTITADPDGRSVVFSCEIENRTSLPVRQVIFPELGGLLPVGGVDHTIFKTCGCGTAPFRELIVPEVDQFYAENRTMAEYKSGGMFTTMWGRWFDLGGYNGGLSIFPRRWGWDTQTSVILNLRQTSGKLRILCAHPMEIPPGQKWSSGEWILTPHRGGWAKGIEPYRQWVKSKVNRRYTMPAHIRDGLGFRTAWVCQSQPNDPADAVWKFSELPSLAQEAKDHGLTELVLWGAMRSFDTMAFDPFPHLGTPQEFADAIKKCRDIGVQIVPLYTVLQASPISAPRYGLKITSNNGWTYHTELVPRWNPPYATGYSCVQVGPANLQWQEEVVELVKRWADKGLPSVCWDQYWTTTDKPTMQDITQRLRDDMRSRDPESSFSGEELWNIEIDCEWLDYTWNWGGYRDCQAFNNAFPAPRRNVNIDRSVAEARFSFMDNLFLNVWPAKPGGINGSERIANVPQLSETLKRCALLRRQFLPYFTQGILIGNCLLTEPSPGVRLSAYVFGDRVLAIVLNQGPDAALSFSYDLSLWTTGEKSFSVTRFDETGKTIDFTRTAPAGTLQTPTLKSCEMIMYEFVPAKTQ